MFLTSPPCLALELFSELLGSLAFATDLKDLKQLGGEYLNQIKKLIYYRSAYA